MSRRLLLISILFTTTILHGEVLVKKEGKWQSAETLPLGVATQATVVRIADSPDPDKPDKPDKPDDPTPDPSDKWGLKTLSRIESAKVDSPHRQKVRLVYASMAILIQRGEVTEEDAFTRIRQLYQILVPDQDKWSGFISSVHGRFNELAKTGKLTTKEQVAEALGHIAEGLDDGSVLGLESSRQIVKSALLKIQEEPTRWLEIIQWFFEVVWPILIRFFPDLG